MLHAREGSMTLVTAGLLVASVGCGSGSRASRLSEHAVESLAEDELTTPAALYAAEVAKNAGDPVALAMLARVYESAGFNALPPHQGMRLLALLGGKNTNFSAPARAAYAKSGFANTSKLEVQQEILAKLVQPANRFVPKSATPLAKAEVASTPYGQDLWPRGNGYQQSPGQAYGVRLTYDTKHSYDKAVDFYQVKHADPWFSAQDFGTAMAVLPERYAAFVPTYRISEWDDGTSGDTGVEDGVSDINATSPVWRLPFLVAHESSHSAWYLLGLKKGMTDDQFVAAQQDDGIYVSDYATANTAELIAETGTLYVETQTSPFAAEYRAIFNQQLRTFGQIFE